MRAKSKQKGTALIIAMMFVSLVAVLSTSLVMSANINLATADNSGKVLDARLAAESGIEFMTYQLRSVELTTGPTIASVMDAIATTLATELDGTTNLGAQTVSYDDTTLTIPAITLPGGDSFTTTIAVGSWNTLLLTVTGQITTDTGTISRTIAMEAQISSGGASNYSVYAKGPVNIGMNVTITGVNNDDEASIVSAASGAAISISSGSIQGSVAAVQEEGTATIDIGSTEVSGETLYGVICPEPIIDVDVFTVFADYQTIDEFTDLSNIPFNTLTNATIEAGTNPEFDNDITINGVLYIKSPNVVTFKNKCTMTGVMVSATPLPGYDPAENIVYFNNNLTANSVAELPDIDPFTVIRTMAGSSFLLPGFKLEIKNNLLTTIAGNIAAEEIVMKNNVTCSIKGNLFALGDAGLTLNNNAELTIDTSDMIGSGPGLMRGDVNIVKTLMLLPDTYAEN